MKKFKIGYYVLLIVSILLFFTRDYKSSKNNFYKNIKQISNPDDLLVLVNKNYQLPNSYTPSDLEKIPLLYANSDKYLRHEAKIAFETLSNDALLLGYRIVASSAYRDYDYQKKLFDYYVKEKGLDYALECSAKPGHSEHQTGLSVDVEGSNKDYDNFEVTSEYEWMKNNSYKYGFILRYPKGKEEITGFKFEPWHYRYVGINSAKIIHDKNITLEEYVKNSD